MQGGDKVDAATRRMDADASVARTVRAAHRGDALADARVLAELEHRLFGGGIEPVRLQRYVLLERIGAGGFGSVYLAYDPKLDRRVAIKVLDTLAARDIGRDALLDEAKALACFSHPNVVAVYDVATFDADGDSAARLVAARAGGLADEGIFLVMEYIEGHTLGRWAESVGPSRRRIVEALVQAAEGLAAAHDAGIVHGDFKPANVMVGVDGRVRILDFGLARVAGQPDPVETGDTYVRGTPQYMAPEHIEGHPADALGDQYAFGATLYRLLCGQAPFPEETLADLLTAKAQAQVAPAVPTHVPKYLREILRRSLSPDPAQRFADMRQLCSALVRERRRRWLRWGPLVGSVALASIGAMSLAATVDPSDAACASADEQLHGVWDAQVRARLEARFVATSVPNANEAWGRVEPSLSDYAQRWQVGFRQVCEAALRTTREAPFEATAPLLCLERGRSQLAALVRVFDEADALVVTHAVETTLDLPAVEACLSATRSEAGVVLDEALRDEALAVEAAVMRANALGLAGRIAESLDVAREAADRAGSLDATSTRADALLTLGIAQRRAGTFAEAEATLADALEAAETAGMPDAAVRAMTELLRTLTEQRRLETADGVRIVASARVARGDVGDGTAAGLSYQIGVLRLAQGRPRDAVSSLRDGLARAEAVYGAEHPRVAAFHNSLGNAWSDQGDYERAIEAYERALALDVSALGEHHPGVALVLNNLGNARHRQGDAPAAIALYRRALAIAEVVYPTRHPDRAMIHGNLAFALSEDGHFVEAMEQYTRALETRPEGSEQADAIASLRHSRGFVALGLGRPDEALADLAVATDLRTQTLGPDAELTLRSRDAMGEALSGVGRLDEALAHQEQVLRLRVEAFGEDHPEIAISLLTLADTHERRGDRSEALRMREGALAIRTRAFGPDDPATAWAQHALACSRRAAGDLKGARTLSDAAIAGLTPGSDRDSATLLPVLIERARIALAMGSPATARQFVDRAIALAESIDGLAVSETEALRELAAGTRP